MRQYLSRREWLRCGLGSLFVAANPLGFSVKALASGPSNGLATKSRRHFVNVIVAEPGAGGWNANWFHAAITRKSVVDLYNAWQASPSSVPGLGGNGQVPAFYIFDSYNSSGSSAAAQASVDSDWQFGRGFDKAKPAPFGSIIYNMHQDDSDTMTMPDGQGSMGVGMKSLYGSGTNGNALLNKMLVWRNMVGGVGHGATNRLMLQGGLSSYAKSFSAIIAGGIAQNDYPRELHYVMLASSPDAAFSNFATNAGYEIPLCIPDFKSLNQLSSVNPNDLQSLSRRQALEASVSRMGQDLFLPRLQTKIGKQTVSSFGTNFLSAIQVGGSNFASSWDFMSIYCQMIIALCDESTAFFGSDSNSAKINTRLTQFKYPSVTNVNDLKTGIINLLGTASVPAKYTVQPPAPANFAAVNASLQALLTSSAGAYLPGMIITVAYQYAVAAYLIKTDLTAVIDLFLPNFDYHSNFMAELQNHFVIHAGFKQLMLALQSYVLPNDPSKSLLDVTQLVMHSEMDRNPYFSDYCGGTDHGFASASIILAGYGVNGGHTVGAQATTLKDMIDHGVTWHQSLPIDLNTGLARPLSQGGQYTNVLSMLPTLVNAFGFSVPLQQVTDSPAIAAILKKS